MLQGSQVDKNEIFPCRLEARSTVRSYGLEKICVCISREPWKEVFIGFIVSGVFISILWYPALWIMVAFVVALRNISETQSEGALPTVVQTKRHWGVPLPRLGEKAGFSSLLAR